MSFLKKNAYKKMSRNMRIDRSKDNIEKLLQIDKVFVRYGFVT